MHCSRGLAAGAGPAIWTPKILSTTKLWLRAGVGVALSGSTITSWLDQVGGVSFAPLGAPTLLGAEAGFGGQPAISFDGVDDTFSTAGGPSYSGGIAVIAAVKKIPNAAVFSPMVSFGAWGGNIGNPELRCSPTDWQITMYDGAGADANTATSSNDYMIVAGTYNQATGICDFRRNGVSIKTSGSNRAGVAIASGGVGKVYLGIRATADTGYARMILNELVVLDGAPSTSAIQQVERYLGRQTGIAVA